MPQPILFSIIESPTHPDFSAIYSRHNVNEIRLTSIRKAISALKQQKPDIVVGEFFYGYGNNYAGVNISNLDVFLFSLQKYAPQARIILMVDKAERQHVDKLSSILPLHAVFTHPVSVVDFETVLLSATG